MEWQKGREGEKEKKELLVGLGASIHDVRTEGGSIETPNVRTNKGRVLIQRLFIIRLRLSYPI